MRWFAIPLLLSLSTCTTKSSEDTDGANGTPICERWIECVANTTPDAFPDTQAAYGPSGTCWDAGDPALCETACRSGIDAQSIASPDELTCGECVSNAECSGETSVCNALTRHCVGCLSDDDCTDPASPLCGTATQTCGDGSVGTGGETGQSCGGAEGEQSCSADGLGAVICTDGVEVAIPCDGICADANFPPGKQVGACVESGAGPACLCADSVGGTCVGNEPRTCTSEGQLQLCDSGRFFGLECSTECADQGYATAGPCVSGEGQGAADCVCADGLGASCALSEQFTESCASAQFLERCVDGQWYQTDCAEECARQGSTGGACELNGAVSSCVCG